MGTAAPAGSNEQGRDAGGGVAGSVEHLPPAEPHRRPTVHRGVEVPVQVEVALTGRVVEEPAVELDQQRDRVVVDIPEGAADPGATIDLATSTGEPVRTLDAHEIAVLQGRAGPVGDVA